MDKRVYIKDQYLHIPGATVLAWDIRAIYTNKYETIIAYKRDAFSNGEIVVPDKDKSILNQALACFNKWRGDETEETE